MTKRQIGAERGRALFGILINHRNTLAKYETELRKYLLAQTAWEDVEAAEREARYWGATQEDLNEANRSAYGSISEDEIINAVAGN